MTHVVGRAEYNSSKPEILVDDFEANPAQFMKPAFDHIWNACGLSRSSNYEAEGKRVEENR